MCLTDGPDMASDSPDFMFVFHVVDGSGSEAPLEMPHPPDAWLCCPCPWQLCAFAADCDVVPHGRIELIMCGLSGSTADAPAPPAELFMSMLIYFLSCHSDPVVTPAQAKKESTPVKKKAHSSKKKQPVDHTPVEQA